MPCWVNWLSDAAMLPAVVPSARIMRYGYESAWFGGEAIQQSASEVAVRLLRSLKRVREVRSLVRVDGDALRLTMCFPRGSRIGRWCSSLTVSGVSLF